MREDREQEREELRVLLIGVSEAERSGLSRFLARTEPRLSLLAVASPADALACLQAERFDALVSDWSVFSDLRRMLVESSPAGQPVPMLVLVPPTAEESAAALLEQESAEFVLQSGNYPMWLLARLRRAWHRHRQETSWGEVARVIRHELNNPLTGVLGNAELILADAAALPEKVPQRLSTIIDLAVRLRDVVRTLEERIRRPSPTRPELPARELSKSSSPGTEVLR